VVGPLSVVEGLYRTTGGGQIYFFSDGSYFYISAAGFSGTDSVEFTAVDSSNAVAGIGTLTIDVAATALLPFVSIGTQLGERHVVDAGFPTVGDGIRTSASQPVALTGGGYVITVDYLDQAPGSINQVQTYDANNNLVGTFDPGTFVRSLKTTALTNGDYVVGWDTSDNSGSPTPTLTGHVELFDATGTALAGPVALDLPGGATGITQIAALPGGGFEVLQFASGGTQLFGWSFDAAGVPRRERIKARARGPPRRGDRPCAGRRHRSPRAALRHAGQSDWKRDPSSKRRWWHRSAFDERDSHAQWRFRGELDVPPGPSPQEPCAGRDSRPTRRCRWQPGRQPGHAGRLLQHHFRRSASDGGTPSRRRIRHRLARHLRPR
jgi:hypothetical protein